MSVDWRKVEEVFAETIERPAAEWAAFAIAHCDGEPETLAEVLRLLDAQRRMGDFLQNSLLDLSRRVDAGGRDDGD